MMSNDPVTIPAPVTVEHGLIDVSTAENATQALLLLAQTLQTGILNDWDDEVDVNTGYLFMSPAQVRRISKLLEDVGKPFGLLFTQVPQTQQSALSQGFMVRESPIVRPPRTVIVQEIPAPVEAIPDHHVEAFVQALTDDAVPLRDGSGMETVGSTQEGSSVEVQSTQVDNAFESETLEMPMEPTSEVYTPSPLEPVRTNLPQDHASLPTKVLRGNLRSGRCENYEGHLVVIGDVHTGAELKVKGDIIVWGELRGLVHAGYRGSRDAEVRALKLDAVQIRISDIMARRPDRQTQLPHLQEPWKAPEGSFFPEIARVREGEIQLYTTRRHHS